MMVDINLLPPKTRQQRWGKVVIGFVIIFIVIISGSVFAVYEQKLNMLHQSEHDVMLSKAALKETVNQQGSKNVSQVLQLETSVHQVKGVSSNATALMMTCISLLPQHGYITNYSFDEQQGVVLSVQFKSLYDLSTYLHVLQGQTLFSHVTMGDVKQQFMTNGSGGYATQIVVIVNKDKYKKLGGGS